MLEHARLEELLASAYFYKAPGGGWRISLRIINLMFDVEGMESRSKFNV